MKQFHTITISGQDYKLRLTASAILAIEKKLDMPIFDAISLENIRTNIVETITTILWGAIQPFDPSFTINMAMELFDQYIDDGNPVDDLIGEINTLFEVSGFFNKGQTA